MIKPNITDLHHAVTPLLCEAAAKARYFYSAHHAEAIAHQFKPDQSIVTLADTEIEKFLIEKLSEITPEIPIISEEDHAATPRHIDTEQFWLIDPIDGSKHFWLKTGQFSINIALIQSAAPILAFISSPTEKIFYSAIKGLGSFKQNENMPEQTPLHVQPHRTDRTIEILSGAFGKQKGQLVRFLESLPIPTITPHGSALKFCKIASGDGDLYPRFTSIMEWDTAAGQLILEEAGGAVLTRNKKTLTYHKKDFINPGFIAIGDKTWLEHIDFSLFFDKN